MDRRRSRRTPGVPVALGAMGWLVGPQCNGGRRTAAILSSRCKAGQAGGGKKRMTDVAELRSRRPFCRRSSVRPDQSSSCWVKSVRQDRQSRHGRCRRPRLPLDKDVSAHAGQGLPLMLTVEPLPIRPAPLPGPFDARSHASWDPGPYCRRPDMDTTVHTIKLSNPSSSSHPPAWLWSGSQGCPCLV